MKRFWVWLTRMRTAIILLLVLGAAAAVGSFFPQRSIDVRAVNNWIARNPTLEPVMEALGLFDVYGSWWFMAIYGLLLISLVGCLTRRYRAQIRAVRSEPRMPTELSARERYVRAHIDATPDQALEAAERLMKRHHFRRARIGSSIAGERGHLRESGSLVFHTSIFVLLAGVTIARLFGATGQVLLVEGDTFIDNYLAYDTITQGRAFGDRHTGFEVTLDEFTVEWHPSGVPRLYESEVTVVDAEGDRRETQIRVNEPIVVSGRTVYQIAWGWAPVLDVAQDGKVLFSGPTVFLPTSGAWTGVAKVPQITPQQMGLAMQLFVDPYEDEDGVLRDHNREPRDPVIVAQVLAGNLNLEKPQSVYALDPQDLSRLGQRVVGLGRTVQLPNDVTLSFRDLVQYSVLQVGYNPGSRVLLLGGLGLLLGVIPGLYSFRRRLWVRATAADGGTLLEVAGHAFQRKSAADEEFASFVKELDYSIAAQLGKGAQTEGASTPS